MGIQGGRPQSPGDDALERAMLALDRERPQDAELIASSLLKSNPGHLRAMHVLGCALLMQGRAKDAVAVLEPAARGRHDPAIDTQLAIALRQVGRQDDALSRLQRTIKRPPPYAPAFHELGYLLFTLKRHDEAADALRRGIEAAPMMPEMPIQLGHVLLACRKLPEAKAAFERALGIAPASFDALFGLARAHQEVGEAEIAAKYFRQCLTARPRDTGLWLNLGHCLLELGQRDNGYDCFRTAARGDAGRYRDALASLVRSGRGRFWLKPSAAAKYFHDGKN